MFIFNSSIGRKLIMSLSGLFLITFLVVHLTANLGILLGAEVYNAVCEFMDTNPLIKVMVPVLAAGFVIHIIYAFWLTLQNQKARGNDKYASSSNAQVSWASKNMLVLGVIVLGFLGLHLTHFWSKMQLQHFIGGDAVKDAYGLAVNLFTNPIYSAMYIIWVWALWFHLNHGFWSSFQTMGLNNNTWMPRLKVLSLIVSTVIVLGYTIIPLYVMIVHGCACCGICQ